MPYKELIHWSFDEESGVRHDETGNGYDLTPSGESSAFSAVPAHEGNGLRIDSPTTQTDFALLTMPTPPADALTTPQLEIEFYIQFPDALAGAYGNAMIALSGDAEYDYVTGIELYVSHEGPGEVYRTIVFFGLFNSEVTLGDGDLHKLRYVYNGTQVAIYLDDDLLKTISGPMGEGFKVLGGGPLVGIRSPHPDIYSADGTAPIIIDEFKLSCFAPDEASETTPEMSNEELLVYWPLDEDASPRADASGNGYDLTYLPGYDDPEAIAAVVNKGAYWYKDDLKNWSMLVSDEMPDAPPPGPAYKWEFWFKLTADDNQFPNIAVFLMMDSGTNNAVGVYRDLYNLGKFVLARFGTILGLIDADDGFHHIELVSLDGVFESLYYDGELWKGNYLIPKILRDGRFISGETGVNFLPSGGGAGASIGIVDEVKLWSFETGPPPEPILVVETFLEVRGLLYSLTKPVAPEDDEETCALPACHPEAEIAMAAIPAADMNVSDPVAADVSMNDIPSVELECKTR